jgi:hypothetical protein
MMIFWDSIKNRTDLLFSRLISTEDEGVPQGLSMTLPSKLLLYGEVKQWQTEAIWQMDPLSWLYSPITQHTTKEEASQWLRCTYIRNLRPLPTSIMMMKTQQASKMLGFSSAMMSLTAQEDFNVNVLWRNAYILEANELEHRQLRDRMS